MLSKQCSAVSGSRSSSSATHWLAEVWGCGDLQAGEELLLDYGRTYWRGREHQELD